MISQYNRAKRVVTKLITCKKKIICPLRQKNKIVQKVKGRASAKGKLVRLQEVKQQQRRSTSRAAAFDYSGVKELRLFSADYPTAHLRLKKSVLPEALWAVSPSALSFLRLT